MRLQNPDQFRQIQISCAVFFIFIWCKNYSNFHCPARRRNMYNTCHFFHDEEYIMWKRRWKSQSSCNQSAISLMRCVNAKRSTSICNAISTISWWRRNVKRAPHVPSDLHFKAMHIAPPPPWIKDKGGPSWLGNGDRFGRGEARTNDHYWRHGVYKRGGHLEAPWGLDAPTPLCFLLHLDKNVRERESGIEQQDRTVCVFIHKQA